MPMRTLLVPAERHRGARVFWTLLVLAVVVAIASPYVLGLDDTLQLGPRVARLVPVKPQIEWPPITVEGSASRNATPASVSAAVLVADHDVAPVAGTSAGRSAVRPRSRPSAVRGASAPNANGRAKATKAKNAAKAKQAAKAKNAAKTKNAAKPKQAARAAAPAATSTQSAPNAKPKQATSVQISAAQPQPGPAKAKGNRAANAAHAKAANKPGRHP